jgi:hypothetical protein
MLDSDAAQGVERLGPRGLPVDEVAVPRLLREALRHERLHEREHLAVGVEDAVHLPDEARPMGRVEQLGRPEVAVLPVGQPLVVRDVARRLLEIGHEPSPLEDFGQQVGGLLAGQVDTA